MRIVQKEHIIVAGYVPADAETKTTSGGKCLVEFSVKMSDNDDKTANWAKCTAWESQETLYSVSRTVRKGDFVQVAGTYTTREFTKRDGSTGTSVDVACEYISVCGLEVATVSVPAPSKSQIPQGFEQVECDDLPF